MGLGRSVTWILLNNWSAFIISVYRFGTTTLEFSLGNRVFQKEKDVVQHVLVMSYIVRDIRSQIRVKHKLGWCMLFIQWTHPMIVESGEQSSCWRGSRRNFEYLILTRLVKQEKVGRESLVQRTSFLKKNHVFLWHFVIVITLCKNLQFGNTIKNTVSNISSKFQHKLSSSLRSCKVYHAPTQQRTNLETSVRELLGHLSAWRAFPAEQFTKSFLPARYSTEEVPCWCWGTFCPTWVYFQFFFLGAV